MRRRLPYSYRAHLVLELLSLDSRSTAELCRYFGRSPSWIRRRIAELRARWQGGWIESMPLAIGHGRVWVAHWYNPRQLELFLGGATW